MSLNIPLAQQVLDYLIAHPERHDQSMWGKLSRCGTTACIAGTTLLLSGDEFDYDVTGYVTNADIPERAAELLGVTAEFDEYNLLCGGEAFDLFYTMDEDIALDKLRKMIQRAKAVQQTEAEAATHV